MKGSILSITPDVRLVDISHQITTFDVMEAAFVLRQAVPYYPADTIHLVVVDPGVGSKRRPIALRYNGQYFAGPDNGLFALLLGDEKPDAIVTLDRQTTYRTTTPSPTFHGRDIFAPAAAHLAAGGALADLGSPIDALVPLHWALPIDDEQGIRGWIVHIDHFGNCTTNIPRSIFAERRGARSLKCYVGNAIITEVHPTYSDVEASEPLLVFGSEDYLEVAVNTGNASDLLDIRRGMPVNVVFVDGK